jgi:hypothetical protein
MANGTSSVLDREVVAPLLIAVALAIIPWVAPIIGLQLPYWLALTMFVLAGIALSSAFLCCLCLSVPL